MDLMDLEELWCCDICGAVVYHSTCPVCESHGKLASAILEQGKADKTERVTELEQQLVDANARAEKAEQDLSMLSGVAQIQRDTLDSLMAEVAEAEAKAKRRTLRILHLAETLKQTRAERRSAVEQLDLLRDAIYPHCLDDEARHHAITRIARERDEAHELVYQFCERHDVDPEGLTYYGLLERPLEKYRETVRERDEALERLDQLRQQRERRLKRKDFSKDSKTVVVDVCLRLQEEIDEARAAVAELVGAAMKLGGMVEAAHCEGHRWGVEDVRTDTGVDWQRAWCGSALRKASEPLITAIAKCGGEGEQGNG